MDLDDPFAEESSPPPEYHNEWDNLKYVDHVSQSLKCGICLTPFYEPVTTVNCEHTFCRSCLEQHLVSSTDEVFDQCPYCRADLDIECCSFCQNLQLDDMSALGHRPAPRIVREMVDELVIKCTEEICNWTGPRQSLTTHLETCLFVLVPCVDPNCSKLIRRTSQRDHCLHYQVKCPACETAIEMAQRREHRSTTCSKRKVRCEKCIELVPYDQLGHHKGLCSQADTVCRYRNAGSQTVDMDVQTDALALPPRFFKKTSWRRRVRMRRRPIHVVRRSPVPVLAVNNNSPTTAFFTKLLESVLFCLFAWHIFYFVR